MLCWDAAVASFPVLGHGDRLPFVALSAPIRLIDAESAGRSQLQSLQLLGQGRLAHSFFAKAKPYQLSRAVVLEQIQAAIYLCSMLVHCKYPACRLRPLEALAHPSRSSLVGLAIPSI